MIGNEIKSWTMIKNKIQLKKIKLKTSFKKKDHIPQRNLKRLPQSKTGLSQKMLPSTDDLSPS